MLALAIPACSSDRASDSSTAPPADTVPRPDPPAYDDIARRYNERADRLTRVWARATVQLSWTDERGRRRDEQGEGHLQLIQPSSLALSVGKLGEVLFWLGCDDERYWLFERGDADRAAIGRHANVGLECSRALGAPVHPLDLIEVLGVTPLPVSDSGVGPSPGRTAWSSDGRWLVVEAPARTTVRRLLLDPATLVPTGIELSDPRDAGGPLVRAVLEDFGPVTLAGVGGFFPQMPTRIEVRSAQGDDRAVLHLSDMSDGRRNNRLSPDVFDFAALRDALAPRVLDVLDADCPNPALPP